MKLPLRIRFSLYALAGAAYLVGIVASAAFVGLPSLLRVDRTLAPLQSVFVAISERQNRVVRNIELLERLIHLPAPPEAHDTRLQRPGLTAPQSLLSLYGSLLDSAAAKKLAIAEDELGAIESAFGEAVARYQLGDTAGVEAKLLELRQAEDRSQVTYNAAMLLALNAGLEARNALQRSMVTLAWVAAAWILVGVLLVAGVGYDANRHVWHPIHALDQGVRHIAAGDWSRPVRAIPGDELGELAAQFNALTETLQRRAGQHAQLATAGELLAGVAHELNNPLQAIRGTAELRSSTDPANRDWATVLTQAERASKLAHDLVEFVRPATRELKLISINDVVREAVNLIEFQYRADGIGLEVELASPLPGVKGDPHEVVQVIVNLLGNAHGVLKRSTGPRRVFVRTWNEADRVYCRIHDTGPGIPAELYDRVFSPFFSTNERGTGLGLTVSRSLVRGAGGELELEREGPGASFRFWLPAQAGVPATEAPAEVEKPVVVVQRANPLEGATILVADDEDAIRGVLERFFNRDGARVIGVAGGVAALEKVRSETVDALVLDVRMPDMDGAAVYRELQKKHPRLASRVIFLSGDVSQVIDELALPRERVLVKPVELSELKAAVVEVLGSGVRASRG